MIRHIDFHELNSRPQSLWRILEMPVQQEYLSSPYLFSFSGYSGVTLSSHLFMHKHLHTDKMAKVTSRV